MRKSFAFLVALCVATVAALTSLTAQQVSRTSAPTSIDDVLKAVRGDLQASRADIIAKNVSLTSDQAAMFWPVFQKYQQEQNAIMDEQMNGLQQYAATYDRLDDAAALALMNANFDRDTRMNELRQRWLVEFQKVLPTKLAVRVMQIDRHISLAHQIQFAAQIPLAY